MAENGEATLDNHKKESKTAYDSKHDLLLHNIHDMIVKSQSQQKEFNEKVLKEFEKLSKENQEMKKTDQKQEIELLTKSIDNRTSSAPSDTKSTLTSVLPPTGKSFVLKHVAKNVLNMKKNESFWSKREEHYGGTWHVGFIRMENHLGICLKFSKSIEPGKWTLIAKLDVEMSIKNEAIKVFGDLHLSNDDNGPKGWEDFVEWEKLEKELIDDGKLVVEIRVAITEMAGIYKDNLRIFDDSMGEFSDVVLVVKDTKFHTLKLFLATHSSYFKTLFLGKFQESKKSEIKLSGIDSDDFQNYLEVLYGDNSIDETTVEGILLVADMYDTPIVIQKCEIFLLNESKKPMKKKLEMAVGYNLENLKKKCLSEIKSTADIKSVLPGVIEDMDHSTMAELLEKAVEFNR